MDTNTIAMIILFATFMIFMVMRDINNEIMRQIADVLYDKVEMEENE